MHSLPSYAYVLFAALVYVGVRRCFAREIRPARAIVFPFLFVGLGASSLHSLFPLAGVEALPTAVAALAAGASAGWFQAKRWQLGFSVSAKGLLVRLPGDPSLLVTLLLTFAAETIMHYAVASSQPWARTDVFVLVSCAAWGMLAGMPLGRSANVVVRSIRYSSSYASGNDTHMSSVP